MTAGARTTLLVVQHEADGGPGRLTSQLAAVAELDVRRPDTGDPLPGDLRGYGGLVVLGGGMGATDDDVAPWLPATRRLLAAAVEGALPALGICLGAQLLAVATGGRVERGAPGLEVGVVPVQLHPAAAQDALLGGLAAAHLVVEVPQFHQDAVTVLPPGAVLLASGERYPHQAYRLGECAWGLQYHPEVTPEDFAGWLRDGHGVMQAAGLDAAHIGRGYTAAESRLAPLAAAHADGFAAVLTATASAAVAR